MTNYFRAGPPAGELGYFEVNDDDPTVWVGIEEVTPIGGTWTRTRVAQGNIVLRKTAADNTTHLVISLRNILRSGYMKSYRISGFDLIYGIATADLEAHTVVLDTATFANNTAVAVAAAGGTLSGTLAVAEAETDPHVTRITLASPISSLAALQDLRLEVEIDAAATSVYDFYGCRVVMA